MEIEAKFVVPDWQTFQDLQLSENLGGFDVSPGEIVCVHDTYLDTADQRILAAGYACRRRRQDDQVLATLKGLNSSQGAVHSREELEVTLPTAGPPAQWPDSAVRDRVLSLIGQEPLIPLFELHQKRLIRSVHRGERLVAQLSLDEVAVQAGDTVQSYYEAEVELCDAGTDSDLAEIVACLEQEWQLPPQTLSKFERTLHLLEGPPASVTLLTARERSLCQSWATRPDRFRRRALLLMSLDDGHSHSQAAEQTSFSTRTVRYWLARFKRERLNIFPVRVRAEAAAQAEPLALVDTLERLTNAVAVDQSKAGDLAPEPVPAEPALQLPDRPGLAMDDSMAEAARATLYFHWRRLLYHEPEARKGADPEALHDMRVATRRMRAAMQMFEAYVGTKRLAPFVKGMRRTGQILGAVRDLDVFHEKAQLYLDSLPASQAHDLDPLLTVWQAQRDASRKDMLAYLDSGRFQRFRTEFGQFLKEPDLAALSVFTRGGQPIPYRLRHVVPWVVQRRVATVRAFGEWVTGSDVPLERLHRLRIACKRLRYALEFFEEVLASDVDDLIEEMKKLQDHLGNLQDAVVACNLLRDFLTWGTWGHAASQDSIWPTAPIVAPGVATYMAFRQKEIQELVKAFPQQWERLQSPEFGSKLEKVLAVLW